MNKNIYLASFFSTLFIFLFYLWFNWNRTTQPFEPQPDSTAHTSRRSERVPASGPGGDRFDGPKVMQEGVGVDPIRPKSRLQRRQQGPRESFDKEPVFNQESASEGNENKEVQDWRRIGYPAGGSYQVERNPRDQVIDDDIIPPSRRLRVAEHSIPVLLDPHLYRSAAEFRVLSLIP